MAIQFCDRFTVGTDPIEIKAGSPVGNGVFPNGIKVDTINIYPDLSNGAYPTYWIGGIRADSNWAKAENPNGIYTVDGPKSSRVIQVKADSGTFTMNLIVKGE